MKRLSIILFSVLLCIGLSVSAKTVRIAVLSDIHITPGNENESRLLQAVEEINACQADAVIMNGDLTNEGSDEQLKHVKGILDKISKPLYVVPGNHEDTWSQSACKTFVDLWGNDRFVFEIDDLIVVGINCGPFMKMGDGHVKQEDLILLEKTLTERGTSGKRVLSFNHYPLQADLDNFVDYVRVLEKFPVITHVNGHYHTYKQYQAGDIPCVMTRALQMGKDNYGYAIVEVSNDSLKVLDKQLGMAEAVKFAYKLGKIEKPMAVAAEPATTLPAGVKVECLYRDNASIFTRVGVDDECVYFGNSLGFVKCVEQKSGKVRWEHKTQASLFSRPALAGGGVIVPTADHRILWLDKTNGQLLAERKGPGAYVADGIVVGETLYQGGYKVMQSWNVNSKALNWENTEPGNYCQAQCVADGGELAFGAWDTYMRLVDAKTGAVKWRWNNGKNQNMLGPGNCVPVVREDKIIMVAPDRFMTAIDRKSGETIWRNNSHKFRESLGVSEDGKVAYAKTMDGELVAVSTEGGEYKELWIIDAGLGYEHAPCIVLEKDGVIYMGSRAGMMVAVDAKKHEVLWRYRLGSSEFNGWEFDAKGNVYTSLIEGSVWKISK